MSYTPAASLPHLVSLRTIAAEGVRTNAEVLRLWHQNNASVGKPNEELDELYSAPNYDSVRHAFRNAFGCPPREMLRRLRMEHAKNLLLESSLSIKEISARVGYVAPNDFNRLFHRYTGMGPSAWRANPLARNNGHPARPDGPAAGGATPGLRPVPPSDRAPTIHSIALPRFLPM